MRSTAGIERGAARGAGVVAVEIRPGRQGLTADATQHRGLVEPLAGPRDRLVVDGRLVTSVAWVVGLIVFNTSDRSVSEGLD